MRDIVPATLIVALLLGLLGWLVQGVGVAEPLVPSPEQVVANFIKPLAAKRYDVARQQLDSSLQAEWEPESLRALDQALKTSYGRYEPEPGGTTQHQGDSATYEARIATQAGPLLQPRFELTRNANTGLWEIASLGELEQCCRATSAP